MSSALFIFCISTLFVLSTADTPANCTYEDLIGTWKFYLQEGGQNKNINCSAQGPIQKVVEMKLSFVDNAIKVADQEKGKFTLIYNQGFEVMIEFRKYFAFFEWQKVNSTYSKYWCNRTMFGWSHLTSGNDWACFIAVKQNEKWRRPELQFTRNHFPPQEVIVNSHINALKKEKYAASDQFVNQLNHAQMSWVAERSKLFENKLYSDVLAAAGHQNQKLPKPNVPKPNISPDTAAAIKELPESFDWRNVDGINYVSPIRNQGSCGSCYAFASAAMIESRIRIITNNTQTPVLSTQQVIGCSEYSQGCDGGFPYLIAGKFAQDFGFMDDSCYPYKGVDTKCQPLKKNCERWYVGEYRYIGGYYGACSEDLMKLSIVRHGPVAVGFEVYPDFMTYKSGVYHHVFGVEDTTTSYYKKFNPFELTNHAVLVVGYGFDEKLKEKYWIVKNSWGPNWGEKGFFRIRRGVDECGIESLAQESFPIPQA